MKRVTRIDRIREALKIYGPMTAKEIAEQTAIDHWKTCALIRESRKHSGKKMRIRQAGKTDGDKERRCWLYELSNEPDVKVEPLRVCSAKEYQPRPTREELAERKLLRELANQIRPFRDPLLFMTAGRAP